MISTNGLGFNSHMGAHVKRKEAVCSLTVDRLYTYDKVTLPAKGAKETNE